MMQEYNGEQFSPPETDQKSDLMRRAKRAYMSNAIMTNLLMTDDAEFDRLQDYLERFERDPENAAVPELLESIAGNIGAMDIMPKNKDDNEQWKAFLETITLDHLKECFEDNIPMDQYYIDNWGNLDISDKWEAVAGIPIKLYFSLYRTVKKDDLPTSADFEGGGEKKDLPWVTAKRTEKIPYPVDKVNSSIWQNIARPGEEGNSRFGLDINMGSLKKGIEAYVYYGIDFSALAPNVFLSKEMNSFDKRIYSIVNALYRAGNEYITISQIYRVEHPGKRPGKKDVERIRQSLEKMSTTYIYISNERNLKGEHPKDSDHEVFNTVSFNYKGYLLPLEWREAYVNGVLAKRTIRLFREPPLFSFSDKRNGLTTLDIQVLQNPFLNNTETALKIDDYLITRISHMKNDAKGKNKKKKEKFRKVLYSTLFKECHISGRKQRERAQEKIIKYLDHYKSCEFIIDYEIDNDGFKIIL